MGWWLITIRILTLTGGSGAPTSLTLLGAHPPVLPLQPPAGKSVCPLESGGERALLRSTVRKHLVGAPSPTIRPTEAAGGGRCSLNKNGFENKLAKGNCFISCTFTSPSNCAIEGKQGEAGTDPSYSLILPHPTISLDTGTKQS